MNTIFKVRILDMYNSEVARANLNFRVYILRQVTFKLPKPLDTTY